MDLTILSQADWSALVDYLAVGIGAVTGALFAVDRKLDIVGTVACGLVTAYGGGIVRDMLLHSHGFFFMQHPWLVVGCVAACGVVFAFRTHFVRLERLLFYADAFSMSWFSLAGASKAWLAGVGIVLSAVLGTVTAVGGGALRDICTGRTPAVFRAGSFYAVSAFSGSALYVALEALGAPALMASISCVLLAFALTLASERFGWHTKEGRS